MSTEDAKAKLEATQVHFKELQTQQKTGRRENLDAATAEERSPRSRGTSDTHRRTYDASAKLEGGKSSDFNERRGWDYTADMAGQRASAK